MAEKTVKVVLGAKDDMSSKLKKAGQSTSGLSKEVGSLKSVMKGVGAASAAIGVAGVAIAALAAKGEDLRTLESSFNSLAAQAGQSGSDMLASMQEASDGLIRNYDLIQNSNKLLAAGIPATADQMGELANAAKRLGIGLGTGAAESMKTLTQAIATGRTTTLAAMGVIVDSKTEIDDWAKAHNKAAEDLTEVEKKTAVFEATLKATSDVINKMGSFSVGLGGKVDQLKVSFANFFDDLAKFTSAFGDSFLLAFDEAFGATEKLGAGLKFNTEVATNFAKFALSAIIDGFVFVIEAVNKLLDVFNLLQTAIGFIGGGFADLFDTILSGAQAANKAMLFIAEKVAPSQAAGFKKTVDQIQEMRNGMIAARDTMNEWGAQGVRDMQDNRDAIDRLTEGAGRLKTAVQNIPSQQITDFMSGAADDSARMENSLQGAAAAVTAINGADASNIRDVADTAEEVTNSWSAGIVSALTSGDVTQAVNSLGDLFEGVSIFGFDIGAILNVVTSLNKELPSLLFQSLKSLLTNLVAELPLLIGNIIPDLLIPLLKLVPDVINKMIENIPVMIEQIILNLPALVEALVNLAFQLTLRGMPVILYRIIDAALTRWMSSGYTKVRDRLISDIGSAALVFLDKIQKEFPAAWESIGAEIIAWWQRTIWSDLTEKLGEQMTKFAAAFYDLVIKPYVDAHVRAAQMAAELFVETFTAFWDNTFGLFPDLVDNAIDAMTKPFDRIIDSLNSIAKKLNVSGGSGGTLGQVVSGGKDFVKSTTGISFASGTDFVPRTGLYQLHTGEQVKKAGSMSDVAIGTLSMPISIELSITGGGINAEQIGQEVVQQIVNNVRGAQDKIRKAIDRKGF